MLAVKNHVVFNADFPDDSKVDSAGNIIMGPGKNIAQALLILFEEAGYKIDTIDEYDNYGWEFQVCKTKSWMRCLIQNANPWLCIIESSSLVMPFINKKSVDEQYLGFLSDFQAILNEDARFSSIKSFTKREYEIFRDNQ
ncbi:MAG: hypothetical protein ACYSTR_06535, partial [Planctomycetota bacterium]|jgi:hypothetical protein